MLHRSLLVHCNPHLKIIDGITVTEDERIKARLCHAESAQQVIGFDHFITWWSGLHGAA